MEKVTKNVWAEKLIVLLGDTKGCLLNLSCRRRKGFKLSFKEWFDALLDSSSCATESACWALWYVLDDFKSARIDKSLLIKAFYLASSGLYHDSSNSYGDAFYGSFCKKLSGLLHVANLSPAVLRKNLCYVCRVVRCREAMASSPRCVH